MAVCIVEGACVLFMPDQRATSKSNFIIFKGLLTPRGLITNWGLSIQTHEPVKYILHSKHSILPLATKCSSSAFESPHCLRVFTMDNNSQSHIRIKQPFACELLQNKILNYLSVICNGTE